MNDVDTLRFERTQLLLGHRFDALQHSHVAVIGLGGVGGYCAEALARSGVGRLTICDMDKVSATNLNRQILATEDTVGCEKALIAQRRLLSINPHLILDVFDMFFHEDSVEHILPEAPDVVVDAIDSLNPKVALIAHCLDHHIPVVSAMGAARRFDPTQIRVSPLNEVYGDRLGARVRKYLRRRGYGAQLPKVDAVWSSELLWDVARESLTGDERGSERGRARPPMGSICHMPAVSGMTCAYAALKRVLKV